MRCLVMVFVDAAIYLRDLEMIWSCGGGVCDESPSWSCFGPLVEDLKLLQLAPDRLQSRNATTTKLRILHPAYFVPIETSPHSYIIRKYCSLVKHAGRCCCLMLIIRVESHSASPEEAVSGLTKHRILRVKRFEAFEMSSNSYIISKETSFVAPPSRCSCSKLRVRL